MLWFGDNLCKHQQFLKIEKFVFHLLNNSDDETDSKTGDLLWF